MKSIYRMIEGSLATEGMLKAGLEKAAIGERQGHEVYISLVPQNGNADDVGVFVVSSNRRGINDYTREEILRSIRSIQESSGLPGVKESFPRICSLQI